MTAALPNGELPPDFRWAALVPELVVSDLQASLRFWCDLLGFVVAYARPEERFAYLQLGEAQVMLEERQEGQWLTARLEPPLGRGINFQIGIEDCGPVLRRLAGAAWPLFRDLQDAWYRTGRVESGQRQFLVQDPDGYLVRLQQPLGERPVSEGAARP